MVRKKKSKSVDLNKELERIEFLGLLATQVKSSMDEKKYTNNDILTETKIPEFLFELYKRMGYNPTEIAKTGEEILVQLKELFDTHLPDKVPNKKV